MRMTEDQYERTIHGLTEQVDKLKEQLKKKGSNVSGNGSNNGAGIFALVKKYWYVLPVVGVALYYFFFKRK
jgi:hypothetical protein